MLQPPGKDKGIVLRRIAIALITVLTSAGILFFFADSRWVLGAIDKLAAANPWGLALSALLVWITFGIAAERYRQVILVLEPGVKAGFPLFFGIGLLTMFAAVLAPVGLAVDAARAGLMPLLLRIRPAASALAVIHDRVLGLLGIAVAGLPLLVLQGPLGVPQAAILTQALIFAVMVAGALMLQLVVPRVSATGRLLGLLHRFFESYTRQLATLPRLLRQSALAIAGILVMAFLFWCLARALDLPAAVSFPLLLAVTPGLYLAHSLPITYAGWGAREAAAIALLSPVPGIGPTDAVALSFAYGAILTLAALPGGLVPLLLSWRGAVTAPDKADGSGAP